VLEVIMPIYTKKADKRIYNVEIDREKCRK